MALLMSPYMCPKYFSTIVDKSHLVSNKLDFLCFEDGINEGEMLIFLNF